MATPLKHRAPAQPGAPAATTQAPLGGSKGEALRRLQMGALGVTAVMLLIGLASMIKDSASQTESTAVAGAAPTTAPATASPAADPLAEAGMVPEIPAEASPGAANRPAARPVDGR